MATVQTLRKLLDCISSAAWFTQLGRFTATARATPLDQLQSNIVWVWLPSSRDERDPIHSATQLTLARQLGKEDERRRAELNAASATIQSLRLIDDRHPCLVNGPHDFTPAAKNAAQFAARMAAREIIVGQCGFWCDAIELYQRGHWPCGLTMHGALVVY